MTLELPIKGETTIDEVLNNFNKFPVGSTVKGKINGNEKMGLMFCEHCCIMITPENLKGVDITELDRKTKIILEEML